MDKQNQVPQAIEELGGADTVREIANSIAIEGTYPIGVHARELLRDLLVGVIEMGRKASADDKAARFREAAMSKHEEAIEEWLSIAKLAAGGYWVTDEDLEKAVTLMRARPTALGELVAALESMVDDYSKIVKTGSEFNAGYVRGCHAIVDDIRQALAKAEPVADSASEPAPEPESKPTDEVEATPERLRQCSRSLTYNGKRAEGNAKWLLRQAARVIERRVIARKPDSKPSAGLLAAAKDVIAYRDSHHVGILCGRFAKIAKVLEQAIAAEEERGAEPMVTKSSHDALKSAWMQENDELRKELDNRKKAVIVIEELLRENMDAKGTGVSCKQSQLVDWVRSLQDRQCDRCHDWEIDYGKLRKELADETDQHEKSRKDAGFRESQLREELEEAKTEAKHAKAGEKACMEPLAYWQDRAEKAEAAGDAKLRRLRAMIYEDYAALPTPTPNSFSDIWYRYILGKIDDLLAEPTAEPEQVDLETASRNYKFRLDPQNTDRCRDCHHAVHHDKPHGDRATCSLLDIEVNNSRTSRCQRHETAAEPAGLPDDDDKPEPAAEPTKRDDGPFRDQIDRQWINALFGLIERHNLDPARELQTVTGDVLASRERKGAPCP